MTSFGELAKGQYLNNPSTNFQKIQIISSKTEKFYVNR
jgi:hypothetical protein